MTNAKQMTVNQQPMRTDNFSGLVDQFNHDHQLMTQEEDPNG
jgi:hypothetical protein